MASKERIRKCCVSSKYSDTGHYARGLHTHGRKPKAHDHATGKGFQKDASTTRAVLRQMKQLGAIE